MTPEIKIILTGGTIDSHFNHINEKIQVNDKPALKDYLDSLKLHIDISYTSICKKDSREINQEDRKNILQTINEDHENTLFLVTHGTFTMPDTAQFLQKNSDKLENKAVLLVGSMKPLKDFVDSDAPFNLGFALASLLHLEPGIYVAMNGEIFNPDEVYKDIEKGKFKTIT